MKRGRWDLEKKIVNNCNKRGVKGEKKISIQVEGRTFFLISKREFTFIRKMRVPGGF